MKELEETHCEVRKVIDLQLSIWDRLNNSGIDETSSSVGSQACKTFVSPLGGFLDNATYAWLSCGHRLVVFSVRTGENIASWTFRENVTCVSQFPTQSGQIPLLLIGLDNGMNKLKDSSGMICIFDCTSSRVLRAIRMPAGVEQVCIVNGGAEWEDFNDKKIENILSESCGVACVVLRNLHHILVDLRRSLWEGENFYLTMDESSPTEINFSQIKDSSSRHRHDKDKHAAYNLFNNRIEKYMRFKQEEFETALWHEESLTTAIISSRKIGCLISGCLGRVIIWQNDGSIEWINPPIENMVVSHLALLEPTDDPRPFYYLWIVYQEEALQMAPVLRMYALLFERKYCDKGTNLYFNLEGEPSLKFEFELDEEDKITSLSTIERDSNQEQTESSNKRGEDSLLLIGVNDRALLFDLNQWYKEQMPRTVSECQNPNSILTSYRMKSSELQGIVGDTVLSCTYVPSTLREFPSNGVNLSEELFYPNSLSLEWVELRINRLVFWMTRGTQRELLREMAIAGPLILIQPSETYHRCLAAGLIPSNTEYSFNSDQNAQREMLLSLCLEQRWATFLIKCAREWSDGSVAYLFPAFLRWGAQRASSIKITADRLCIPLFDQSGSGIGEAEVKTLRFCSQQLECLSNVVATLPVESSDLVKQQRALKRVATHLQVLLWFYDVGLLPETQDMDEETLPISFTLRIPYPYEKLAVLYKEKREQLRGRKKGNKNEEDLFIDELITQECSPLRLQWEREAGDINIGGYYPPPSLQSLLRSYLLDCHQSVFTEIENKHQITIYLLMDLAMLLQGSCPSVDQLIKYPSAFKMSPSLIKLTQAFWLLDHDDYQGFLDMMTGQLVSDSDVKDWHHKLVIKTLVRNNQSKLALTYLRVRKPPLSSIEDQGTAIRLSVECGLVQSAFHHRPPSHYAQLLTCFFEACKTHGKLSDILHLAFTSEEEEALVKFFEEDKYEETRLLYYLQRCRYTEAGNTHPFSQNRSCIHKGVQSASMAMSNAYNMTLPEVTRHFSMNTSRKNLEMYSESRYPRPMSHYKSCNKTQGIHETVIKKAKETYIRGDRRQIPFISAPCMSLRSSSSNTNTSCILFPVLAQKTYGKRTLDQMQQNNMIEEDISDNRKRRKVSEGNDTVDKADTRVLGISATFDTPLVQRRKQITSLRDNPLETPHSILKIRQLIRNSMSPNTIITQLHESKEELSKEKEKKSTRQIRFSINQSVNNNLTQNESIDESESKKDDDKADISEESNDAFFSPNVSNKSYSDSTLLSDSSYSRNISGPRPRPSLRSSYSPLNASSSVEITKTPRTSPASVKSSSNTLSPTIGTSTGVTSTSLESKDESIKTKTDLSTLPASLPIPRARFSLLDLSCYSSPILSPDSSITVTPVVSPQNAKNASQQLEGKLGLVGNDPSISTAHSQSISKERRDTPRGKHMSATSTTFTKSVSIKSSTVTKMTEVIELDRYKDDEEIIIEVDDFGLDREPQVCFADTEQMNQHFCAEDRMDERELQWEVSKIDEVEQSKTIMKERDKDLEESRIETEVQGERESERNRDTNLSVSQEHQFIISDKESDNVERVEGASDNHENDLHSLKEKDTEKEREEDETFESLSNSTNYSIHNTEESVLKECNSTRPISNHSFYETSKFLTEDSNITEDYSSEGTEDVITATGELDEVNEKQTDKLTSLIPENAHNASNFTEDESDSSIDANELIVKEPASKEEQGIIETNLNEHSACTSTQMQRANSITEKLFEERQCLSNRIISDNLEYADSVSSISSNITDNLEKLDEDREQENALKDRSSLSDEVFTLNSDNDNTPPMKATTPDTKKDIQESKNEIPIRMTRSRRASSMAKDTVASSDSESCSRTPDSDKTGRPQRSNTLIKEALMSSVKVMLENVNPVSSSGSESTLETPPLQKGRRTKRSSSLAKDITLLPLKAEQSEETNVEQPVRRSSRRASSVQKELSTMSKGSTKKSKSSSISGTETQADTELTVKKNSRAKRASSLTKDSNVTLSKKSRRASSVAKETIDESQETTKRTTKKRRSSAPPDSLVETPRTRRSSSLAKDIISLQGTDQTVDEPRKGRTLGIAPIEKELTNNPASNTRSRRSSIQSIPEEMEEILSVPSTRSSSNRRKETVVRERRAVSVEPVQSESKRRTRKTSTRSFIADVIVEEPTEAIVQVESNITTTKRTNRRKKTTSETSVNEEEEDDENEEIIEKPRRGRRASQKSNRDNEHFSFSLPSETLDPPSNKQDVKQVPAYVFSPPHTRSKQSSIPQPRRELKHFVSPLSVEEKQFVAQGTSRTDKSVIKRPSKTHPGFRFKFVLPKSS